MKVARSLLALALLLSGCASFVSKQEYADYRAVRMERDESLRLVAMTQYVSRHPDGHWFQELQNERRAREQAVFESGKATRPGLELYLKAYPDGLFRAQAQARLSAVALIEQRRGQEAERARLLAEERKRIEAERNRTWVTRFVGYWAKTLLSIPQWGGPIEQVATQNADFSRAFGRPPRPRCTTEECVKYYDSQYGVPIPGGTRIERTMRVLLRLRLQEGKLIGADLLLPNWGFSRWIEVEERRAVVDADPASRAQAIQAVLGRLQPLLDVVAKDRQPIAGYTLEPIAAPAIDASGELVDTSVEDPASPANRIQGQGLVEPNQPAVQDMLKPEGPEATPDMVLGPIQVGPDGRALPAPAVAPAAPVAAPTAAPEGEMVLDAIAVPKDGQATATPPNTPAPAPNAPAPQPAPSLIEPGTTQAFRFGPLRLVVFAAPTDARAPAYDGLRIELMPPEPAAPKKPKPPKPAKPPP